MESIVSSCKYDYTFDRFDRLSIMEVDDHQNPIRCVFTSGNTDIIMEFLRRVQCSGKNFDARVDSFLKEQSKD